MEQAGRIYDISVPIHPGMVVYEGDPAVSLERITSISSGGLANVSQLDFGVHTGTHIDAPVHFIEGAPGVEETPLDVLIGPALVVDATHINTDIDAEALADLNIAPGTQRLIFKTANSQLWDSEQFSPEFIALTEDAARALAARGTGLVGIDYLSIAPKLDPMTTHRALLESGVVILEGLDLRDVPPGEYELICLPLRIVGSDGAPARAILRDLR
jgi:arylformamidase